MLVAQILGHVGKGLGGTPVISQLHSHTAEFVVLVLHSPEISLVHNIDIVEPEHSSVAGLILRLFLIPVLLPSDWGNERATFQQENKYRFNNDNLRSKFNINFNPIDLSQISHHNWKR
ncbi:hypothetical protein JNK13_00900 [bacterium]|nr:hypothetical protein [bacterium]